MKRRDARFRSVSGITSMISKRAWSRRTQQAPPITEIKGKKTMVRAQLQVLRSLSWHEFRAPLAISQVLLHLWADIERGSTVSTTFVGIQCAGTEPSSALLIPVTLGKTFQLCSVWVINLENRKTIELSLLGSTEDDIGS